MTDAVWSSPSSDPNDETFGDRVIGVTPETFSTVEAVLVGEPFDEGVIGRKGASEGPHAIREALAGVKTHHFERGPVSRGEIGIGMGIGDYGDVQPADTALETIREEIRALSRTVYESSAIPVFLGGDNSLTVPNVDPLLSDSVGVINLDAHLDVREIREDPTSGTPYRELLESGLDTYVCVGARHFETSTTYVEYLEANGGTVITAEALGQDLAATLECAREAVGGVDTVYLSVDCDVLDAAFAPGVSAPTPGGLTPRELFQFVRMIGGDDRLAGVEIVECAPPLDQNGQTVSVAARTVAHVLAGVLDSTAASHAGEQR